LAVDNILSSQVTPVVCYGILALMALVFLGVFIAQQYTYFVVAGLPIESRF
jgi:hypothetical protein